MLMLPPEISTIHIHNLPGQAVKEQVKTIGGHTLLQEYCKNKNCTPAPKLDFRGSHGTSDAGEKNRSSHLLYPGLADSSFAYHQ